MKVVVLFLLGLTAVSALKTCNKVTCDTPADGKCASWATKVWKIKECGSGKACSVPNSGTFADTAPTTTDYVCEDYTEPTPSTPTVTKQLVGVSCSETGGCYSGKCTKNRCEGLAVDAACKTYAVGSVGTDAEKAMLCGSNLYCKADKCAAGPKATEACLTTTTKCPYPLICGADDKCQAVSSIADGTACTTNYQCKTDSYCPLTGNRVCTKMTVKYTGSGGFGFPCTADDFCDPGKCDGGCAAPNTTGAATCTAADPTYTSIKYTNGLRAVYSSATNYCPLGRAPCASGGTGMPEIPAVTMGSCYDKFRMKNGLYLKMPTSSVNVAASLVAFLAYFLF